MQTETPSRSLQLPEVGAIRSDILPFLVACCQAEPSEADIDLINTFLSEAIESQSDPASSSIFHSPSSILATASRHGVLPLVYKNLKTLSEENRLETEHSTMLHNLVTELKSAYMAIAQRNMLMSAELLRLMKLLERNGIGALAFKGPALAMQAYGDITLRQFGDLDILIRHEDVAAMADLMASSGYENTLQIPPNQEKAWYCLAKDMVFYHPRKQIHVEVHWRLLDEDHPVSFDAGSVWENPQTVIINGQEIRTFSNESLICYLGIHGSKHLWERLCWIKDIDKMIRTGAIDWKRIHTDGGDRRMLLLGFYLAQHFFRTPLPDTLRSQMHGCPWLPQLRDFIARDWEARHGMLGNTVAMLRLFPTMRMKLRYLKKVVITPSKHEYRFADFPKGLRWLYYFVRPYLLLRKYLGMRKPADP